MEIPCKWHENYLRRLMDSSDPEIADAACGPWETFSSRAAARTGCLDDLHFLHPSLYVVVKRASLERGNPFSSATTRASAELRRSSAPCLPPPPLLLLQKKEKQISEKEVHITSDQK